MKLLEQKMVFLERIKKRLTMAVLPKDGLTPDKKVIGDVFLQFPKTSSVGKPIIKHNTGYFLFIDFPAGVYRVTARGNYYKQEDFLLDSKTFLPDQPYQDIFLTPKANYPFPDGMTILKGIIVDMEYRPLSEASITIKSRTEKTISEDMGGFFIEFKDISEDINIILNINRQGFQLKEVPVLLRKNTTTPVGTIKLNDI
jgi:hypothetical protein